MVSVGVVVLDGGAESVGGVVVPVSVGAGSGVVLESPDEGLLGDPPEDEDSEGDEPDPAAAPAISASSCDLVMHVSPESSATHN